LTGRFAGVVLAGGDSRRMGRPKAGLALGGRTFLACVVESLAGARVAPIVVVAGRHADAVRAALPEASEAEVVVNPDPDRGQLASLRIALAHLAARGETLAGAVVALVDHPAVRPETVRALVDALSAPARTGAAIAIPSHGGRRGHPVAFARSLWDELAAAPDDIGARAVVRRDPKRVCVVDVDDPGVLVDVDTPADLAALATGGTTTVAPAHLPPGRRHS